MKLKFQKLAELVANEYGPEGVEELINYLDICSIDDMREEIAEWYTRNYPERAEGFFEDVEFVPIDEMEGNSGSKCAECGTVWNEVIQLGEWLEHLKVCSRSQSAKNKE